MLYVKNLPNVANPVFESKATITELEMNIEKLQDTLNCITVDSDDILLQKLLVQPIQQKLRTFNRQKKAFTRELGKYEKREMVEDLVRRLISVTPLTIHEIMELLPEDVKANVSKQYVTFLLNNTNKIWSNDKIVIRKYRVKKQNVTRERKEVVNQYYC